jgi:hypothetical protein
MNKKVLAILLMLSAVLVLYPSMSALVDAQNVLDTEGLGGWINGVPYFDEALESARNKLIMQNLGFISLFSFLGILLYYFEKQPTQQRETNQKTILTETKTSHKESKPTNVKATVPLSKNARNRIFLIGALVFIGVFIWQYIDIYSNGNHDPVNSAIAPIFYGVIASCIVGMVLYFLVRYAVDFGS